MSDLTPASPDKILDISDGELLHRLAINKEINRIHIAKPQNPMHDGQFFARPVKDGGKLSDCLDWVTYCSKNRSKGEVPSRETYFNSEFRSNVAKRTAVKVAKGYVA